MKPWMKKAKSTVESRGFSMTAITVLLLAVVMFLNALLYALDERYGLYLFSASESEIALSGAADAYFEDIKDTRHVKITFCMPEDELADHATGTFVHHTAKQLAERFPSLIELRYVNLITKRDQNGERVDLSLYQRDEAGEEVSLTKTSVIFESLRHFRVLTDTYTSAGFADFFTLNASGTLVAYNGEEMLAAMVRYVLADEHPAAYFTNYHGETADVALRTVLIAAGYTVKEIDLREEEIPADAGLVIISAPQSDFEAGAEGSGVRSEIERLTEYVERGGDLYVARHSTQKRSLPTFDAFLAKYGIRISETTLESGQTVYDTVRDADRAITTDGFTFSAIFAGESACLGDGVLTAKTGVILPAENVTPLLVTSPSAVTEAGGERVGEAGVYTVAAVAAVEGRDGVGHIFVTPTLYLAASDALTSSHYENRDFFYYLFDEYFGLDHLPYGMTPVNLTVDLLENMTMQTARRITLVLALIPTALAVFAVLHLTRRKRR